VADEKEGLREIGEAKIVCKYPDVCKTPPSNQPVPYQIIGFCDTVSNMETSVRMTGQDTFTLKGQVTQVVGDEAGVGGGVVSQVNKSVCEPISWCSNVRAGKKNNVVRDKDNFAMNNKNTVGIADFDRGGGGGGGGGGDSPSIGADNSGNGQADPPLKPTPKETGFLEGFKNHGGEILGEYKGMLGTAKDALGGGEEGSFGAAWGKIWEGTKAVGGLAKDATTLAIPSSPGDKLEAAKRLYNVGENIVTGAAKGYGEAYQQGGLTQVAGHGAADLLNLAAQALTTKGIGKVVEGGASAIKGGTTAAKGGTAAVGKGLGTAAREGGELGQVEKALSKVDEVPKPAEGGAPKARPTSGTRIVRSPAQRALDALGPLRGKTRKEIRKRLEEQGFKEQRKNLYTKDLGDGNSVGVRMEAGDNKFDKPLDEGGYVSQRGTSESLYGDSVPHAHKEIFPTSDLGNGKYLEPGYKGATKLNDSGIPTLDRRSQHIPTQK